MSLLLCNGARDFIARTVVLFWLGYRQTTTAGPPGFCSYACSFSFSAATISTTFCVASVAGILQIAFRETVLQAIDFPEESSRLNFTGCRIFKSKERLDGRIRDCFAPSAAFYRSSFGVRGSQ